MVRSFRFPPAIRHTGSTAPTYLEGLVDTLGRVGVTGLPSLGAGQWIGMDCGMMSGIGSRIFFLGVRAMSAEGAGQSGVHRCGSLSLSNGHSLARFDRAADRWHQDYAIASTALRWNARHS